MYKSRDHFDLVQNLKKESLLQQEPTDYKEELYCMENGNNQEEDLHSGRHDKVLI